MAQRSLPGMLESEGFISETMNNRGRQPVPDTSSACETAALRAPKRFDVLGVQVSATNLDEARQFVLAGLAQKCRGYVTFTTVHGIMEADANPEFTKVLNDASLTAPDGMPLVWLGRLKGHAAVGRVYGPDFMLHLFEKSQEHHLRHYFYGSTEEVLSRLVERLAKRFPRAEIAGAFSPPFREPGASDFKHLRDQIAACRANCLWVGLGCPRQERFMAEIIDRFSEELPAPLFLFGVGAAFDFHAGTAAQAPAWMQKSGLEWLFRLIKEPSRLWRRYLILNPLFIWRLMTRRNNTA